MLSEADNQVDKATGRTLRLYRKAAGLSQAELGRAAGVSFQQIQKYETGFNRLSVSRLFQLAATLGVEPSDFVRDIQKRMNMGETEEAAPDKLEFLATASGRRAVLAMASLRDPAVVDAFADLISAVDKEKQ
jgi:transcriptional regulator with XRE-family HTH domain